MKVAFLNPPAPRYLYRGSICTYISKARYVWKPKDFILLSSVLPPEWPIVFLDAAIDRHSTEAVFDWVAREQPDAIIVATSSIHWEEDKRFLGELRSQFKSKILVFGDAFIEPSFRKQLSGGIDGIITDPLRSNVVAMLQGDSCDYRHREAGQRKDNRLVHTHRPRHELFENPKYRWPFVRRKRFASVYTLGGDYKCFVSTRRRRLGRTGRPKKPRSEGNSLR